MAVLPNELDTVPEPQGLAEGIERASRRLNLSCDRDV